MGRMLIILLLGGGMLFAITTLNLNRSNIAMANNSVQEYNSKEAANIAKSGVEFAIRNLAEESTWTGMNKSLNDGNVLVTVQNTTSRYYNAPSSNLSSGRLITSIGTVGNLNDTIRAVVQLKTSNGLNLPKFMNYAAASGNNLVLKGNDQIVDNNNSQWNANCYVNGDFNMGGWDIIKGFVSYNGEAEADKSQSLTSNITPNQNPNKISTLSKVPKINIPTFNPDDYKTKATIIYNGDQTISGNLSLGSKSNPQIVYVGGNLTLSGNVTGYGVFIVKGNITIKGSVTINGQDPSCSNLGLYTFGDLNTNGGVNINAQVFTGGNANLSSNCNVYGSITSLGTINLNTNVSVYYKPANAYLTNPFWTGDTYSSSTTRPVIVSYLE